MLEDVSNDVNDPINIVNCVNDIINIIIGVRYRECRISALIDW